MRDFLLMRHEDPTGISGTGIVAEGVEFYNGKCVLCWYSKHRSIGVYDSICELKNIHCHNGATKVIWADGVEK